MEKEKETIEIPMLDYEKLIESAIKLRILDTYVSKTDYPTKEILKMILETD